MKKLLVIVVLAIFGWLTYFIWPTENRMVDLCKFSYMGLQDQYKDYTIDAKFKSEDWYQNDDILGCRKNFTEKPKRFKNDWLEDTVLARLDILF